MLSHWSRTRAQHAAGRMVRLALSYGPDSGDNPFVGQRYRAGIAPEHQAHVFDRLYRVREGQPVRRRSRSRSELRQWAAQAHGGQMELRSSAGQGATLTIVLPAAALAVAPEQGDPLGEAPVPSRKFKADESQPAVAFNFESPAHRRV